MQKESLHATIENEIEESVIDAIKVIQQLHTPRSISFIAAAVDLLATVFANGGKLLIAGNGGSLCDAMHFAEELTGFFRSKRPALPAIALSDPGHLTCAANDLGFDHIFSRGIEAYGKPEDCLVVLSTSGRSPNILYAVESAKKLGLSTIAFLGKDGGKLKGICDLELIIEGFAFSDRIQEAHMTAIHIIIEQIEKRLFYGT